MGQSAKLQSKWVREKLTIGRLGEVPRQLHASTGMRSISESSNEAEEEELTIGRPATTILLERDEFRPSTKV